MAWQGNYDYLVLVSAGASDLLLVERPADLHPKGLQLLGKLFGLRLK